MPTRGGTITFNRYAEVVYTSEFTTIFGLHNPTIYGTSNLRFRRLYQEPPTKRVIFAINHYVFDSCAQLPNTSAFAKKGKPGKNREFLRSPKRAPRLFEGVSTTTITKKMRQTKSTSDTTPQMPNLGSKRDQRQHTRLLVPRRECV